MVELRAAIDLNDAVFPFYPLNICVSRAHSGRKRTVTVSPSLLSALLIDAHATIGSLTDCWMNIPVIDVTDNWPDVPASPRPHPHPFHTAKLSLDSECEWHSVFSLQQPRRLTSKLFGLGFIQQAGWHQQQIDAIGPVMKRDFLPQKTFCWWIQAAAEPLGDRINEQLSAHFKVHACCCIYALPKQPHFARHNTVEGIQIVLGVSGLMNS